MANIAIDGPAGAGKSTIARRVAKELSFIYVDTGAMYRAMALFFLRECISPQESERIEKTCEQADITIEYRDGEQQVILNGENVTPDIRGEEVGEMASATSVNAKVRRKLVALQQRLAQMSDVVMDGRDIGTVVLPQADLKIYLTASVKTRAKRRFLELTEKGVTCDLAQIERDIEERDTRDMSREESPLRQAKDAVLIDSSELSIDEVADRIIALYKERT